MVSTGATLNK